MNSPTAYERVAGKLVIGERLLWCGRPVTGFRLRRQNLLRALPILGVLGVLLVVIVVLLDHGENGAVIVPSLIVFMLVYSLIWRAFVEDRRRGRSAYGITDRRVIIINDPKDQRNWSLPLGSLSEITLRERKDRSGSIVCFSTGSLWNRQNKRNETVPRPLFVAIVDVRHIHDMLQDARTRTSESVLGS